MTRNLLGGNLRYFLNVSWSALTAYIHGVGQGIWILQQELGLNELPPTFQEYKWMWEYYFDLWAQVRYKCGPAIGYHALIKDDSKNDEEQFYLFFKYLDEFEQEFEVHGQDVVLKELEEFREMRDRK